MSAKEKIIKKHILGLDFGSETIKIVEGDFNKDKLEIKNSLAISIPDGVFENNEIADAKKIANQLKTMLKKNKIKAKNCFCSFDNNEIISREVTIPSADKEALQSMAQFEVEQFLPIEMSNYKVQSLVLREYEVDDKPFAEMLVTAFPVKFIDELYKVIEMAGLKPVILDTQFNAFSKLVENQHKINGNEYHLDGTVAFIDLGEMNLNVTVMQKGQFRLIRTLKVGGKDLDYNISKSMSISTQEARQKKMLIHNINYSVDEFSDEAKVVSMVKSTMESWFDEIVKIFRYYNTKSPLASIDYIYIYGGGSKINGLTDFVQSYFKIPVEEIKKIDNVSIIGNNQLELWEFLNAVGVMYRR